MKNAITTFIFRHPIITLFAGSCVIDGLVKITYILRTGKMPEAAVVTPTNNKDEDDNGDD